MTNGGYRTFAWVFTKKTIGIKGIQEKVVDGFENLDYIDLNGLKCTTINQTIIDLLKNEGDDQIITEALANYYDTNGASFEGLRIPEHLQEKFQQYCQWAETYYEE